MENISDLTKRMISFYIASIVKAPVEIIEFFEIGNGIQATYKTTRLINRESFVIKKGLFYWKNDIWMFKGLDYVKKEAEFWKEKEEEKSLESVEG